MIKNLLTTVKGYLLMFSDKNIISPIHNHQGNFTLRSVEHGRPSHKKKWSYSLSLVHLKKSSRSLFPYLHIQVSRINGVSSAVSLYSPHEFTQERCWRIPTRMTSTFLSGLRVATPGVCIFVWHSHTPILNSVRSWGIRHGGSTSACSLGVPSSQDCLLLPFLIYN